MLPFIECEDVRIGPLGLRGELELSPDALGLVVFAHGSGSGRHSSGNQTMVNVMHEHRLDTLLFDLLTEAEAAECHPIFDIGLLACRVVEALAWLHARCDLERLPVGLFGASTAAAAIVRVAAERPANVAAVVTRGGRVDLAGGYIASVQAPTLLIVGGLDTDVLERNRNAMRLLRCKKRLEIVPDADRRFEEPGTRDAVAHLAGSWFANHLSNGRSR